MIKALINLINVHLLHGKNKINKSTCIVCLYPE